MAQTCLRLRGWAWCVSYVMSHAALSCGSVTTLAFETSTDGNNWSSTLAAAPGERVLVRVLASYQQLTPGPAPMGLASAYFQPTISNWAAGRDVMLPFASSGTNSTGGAVADLPGRDAPLGRISPFAATGPAANDAYVAHEQAVIGISYVRIARASAPQWPLPWNSGGGTTGGAGSVVASQRAVVNALPSEGGFNFNLINIVVMKFAFTLGQSSARSLVISAPPQSLLNNWQTGVPEAAWYASETDTFGQIRSSVHIMSATVRVVPSPGTFCLLMFALPRRGRN